MVIGGGLMGSSAAFFLRQQGVSVNLVERDRVGQHASGTNFGNVRRQGRPLYQLELANRASEIWRKANSLLGADVEYMQSGHVRICYSNQANSEIAAQSMEDYAGEAREFGLDLELFSGAKLREKFSFFGPDVCCASYSRFDGHANPRVVAPAFARAAQRMGAGVYEQTAVNLVRKDSDDFVVSCLNGLEFRAPALLICTGAWANELSAQFGESVPISSYGPTMSVTEPVRYRVKPSVGVYTPTEQESVYFRQIPRGNVIVGGSFRSIGQPATRKTKVRPGNLLSQLEQLQRLAPSLSNLNIIRSWSGTEGYMPDGQPVMGGSRTMSGLFYAFGFSGAGFQIGPGVGYTMAELIATGSSPIDLSHYRMDRFSGKC